MHTFKTNLGNFFGQLEEFKSGEVRREAVDWKARCEDARQERDDFIAKLQAEEAECERLKAFNSDLLFQNESVSNTALQATARAEQTEAKYEAVENARHEALLRAVAGEERAEEAEANLKILHGRSFSKRNFLAMLSRIEEAEDKLAKVQKWNTDRVNGLPFSWEKLYEILDPAQQQEKPLNKLTPVTCNNYLQCIDELQTAVRLLKARA